MRLSPELIAHCLIHPPVRLDMRHVSYQGRHESRVLSINFMRDLIEFPKRDPASRAKDRLGFPGRGRAMRDALRGPVRKSARHLSGYLIHFEGQLRKVWITEGSWWFAVGNKRFNLSEDW